MISHWLSKKELHTPYPSKVLNLILTSALCGTAVSSPISVEGHGSEDWRKEVHDLLLDTGKGFAEFREMRREAQQLRERERAKIPEYTAALAKATSALQKHVADLHPRSTNCQACRRQVKELLALIKRIEQLLN